MKYNIYYFLYYLTYKYIRVTNSKIKEEQIVESSTFLFLACINMNIIALLIYSRILSYFPSNKLYFYLLYAIIPVTLFFINRKLFVSNERYKEIEAYYDKRNNLKKGHFIFMAVAYMLISIGAMILTGIYYKAE